jgi:hypothetical protein
MKDPYQVLRAELVSAAARADAKSGRRRLSWWPGRSRPVSLILAALVICGSAAAAVVSLTGSPSQPLTGQVPGRIAGGSNSNLPSVAGYRYRIAMTPALDAGSGGWTASISYFNPRTGVSGGGESGGGGYPTRANPVFQGTGLNVAEPGQHGDQVGFVVTGPTVAAVRVGSRTIRTFTSSQLPIGDRAAVFFVRAGSPVPMIWLSSAPSIQYQRVPVPEGGKIRFKTVAIESVAPLDKNGKVIPTRPTPTPYTPNESFWQAPSAVTSSIHEPAYHGRTRPRAGACELTGQGLPALTPEWGHTITSISPINDSVGELFLSCINTEYYLHLTPLSVGVLLDARHPGQALDPIPGARPVPGSHDLVDYTAAHLSAKRVGNAWLVVEGGSSQSQRLKVLQALRVSRLNLHHLKRGRAPS